MPRISLPDILKRNTSPDAQEHAPLLRRISLHGFRDPSRRPRYVVWTGVLVLTLAALTIVALGVTSTRWFCAEGCHKVQGDTITAYLRSTHSEVSCMACHMPVGADPLTFVLHKAEALGELYLTVTGNFELPLNPESHVALEMGSGQCTQCHNLDTRAVTPASGVLIDHDVHEEEGLGCAVCHNRVAHKEDFTLKLSDPKTGERNRKHEEFMSMTGCFRCHDLSGGGRASGECRFCHTPDFELKPPSHMEEGFYPEGHAQLARAEVSRTTEPSRTPAGERHDEGGGSARTSAEAGQGDALKLPKVSSINECYTCHLDSFCSDCHGLPMPHPAEFSKGHGTQGKRAPAVCDNCHGGAKQSCDGCHHGASMDLPYDGSEGPWIKLHPLGVRAVGASRCYDCHLPTYCAYCHVRGFGD